MRGEARAPAAVAAHDHSVDVLRVGVDPLAADEARTLRRREPEEPEPQDEDEPPEDVPDNWLDPKPMTPDGR